MDQKIKTICTIGPASEKEDVFERLVLAGMDIARLNFSHATQEQFLRVKALIKLNNAKHNKNVKLLFDLQGPRMRVGILPDSGIVLNDGDIVVFSTNKENKDAIYINDPYLHEDIQVNHPMFLVNGEIELIVTAKKETEITAKVIRGGTLYSRKAVNVPETSLTTRGLTEKDKKDVAFGLAEGGIDYMAMSFVKDAEDVHSLRNLIGTKDIKICVKMEIKQGVQNLDEIIEATDMMMVARGDLGVELPLEEIPIVQKDIIRRCNVKGKPSIVATQMLLSMVNHAHPTRAEISDIANAVFDGASAVMLSDETAFGSYPVESLQTLCKTALRAHEYHVQMTHHIPLE